MTFRKFKFIVLSQKRVLSEIHPNFFYALGPSAKIKMWKLIYLMLRKKKTGEEKQRLNYFSFISERLEVSMPTGTLTIHRHLQAKICAAAPIVPSVTLKPQHQNHCGRQ